MGKQPASIASKNLNVSGLFSLAGAGQNTAVRRIACTSDGSIVLLLSAVLLRWKGADVMRDSAATISSRDARFASPTKAHVFLRSAMSGVVAIF